MTRADGLKLAFALLTVGLVLAFGPGLLTIGGPGLLFALVVADGVFRPASGVFMPVVTRGPHDRGQVALTFDDGPDPAVTPKVLDALAAHGARATFFVIGRHVEAHPDLAARIVAEGHQLGNHTQGHARTLNLRSARVMQAEIERAEATLRSVPSGPVGRPPYRPPVGLKSPPLARAAQRLGLEVVMWSLHARDTRGASAEAIATRVLDRVRPGDIVLLHDGHDLGGPPRMATAEALPTILQGLAQRGLEAVTVETLLRPDNSEDPTAHAETATDSATDT